MTALLVQVRCPRCNRLAAEAAPGSQLRVKCARCGQLFDWETQNTGSSPRLRGSSSKRPLSAPESTDPVLN